MLINILNIICGGIFGTVIGITIVNGLFSLNNKEYTEDNVALAFYSLIGCILYLIKLYLEISNE